MPLNERRSRELRIGTAAFLSGAVSWVLIAAASGCPEAWDSSAYILIALPFHTAAAAVAGAVEPRRPWRWGVLPFVAQALILFASLPIGPLTPLGLLFFAGFAAPAIAAAMTGAFAARRFQRRGVTRIH